MISLYLFFFYLPSVFAFVFLCVSSQKEKNNILFTILFPKNKNTAQKIKNFWTALLFLLDLHTC